MKGRQGKPKMVFRTSTSQKFWNLKCKAHYRCYCRLPSNSPLLTSLCQNTARVQQTKIKPYATLTRGVQRSEALALTFNILQ